MQPKNRHKIVKTSNKETKDDDLTIIGIGSSAGGLEAIRQLVETLPTDLSVSYVVVQHMSPHHKSLMTALVARDTSLRVMDVEDGLKPKANVIYITPPKTDVIFIDGRLQLVEPSPEVASPKPSVDRFLTSLAQEHGDKSMALILSGTGTDGAYGVQAIREAGGITIAQSNESAKYDGMPQSAIQTGCVDLILSPPQIGEHLQKILTSQRDFSKFRSGTLNETPTSDLLQILLARTRVDFRDYKQTTINRRIERRMVALNIQSEEEYTQFCRTNPAAVDALFKDLLISVTRFFRDKEAFDQLRDLLPKLIEQSDGDQIRIWIAGCATGEEAYSIAMLLAEALGGSTAQFKNKVQIFATDIDREALQVARRGTYGLSALNDIPAEYADKYLIRQNDSVRVIDNLRGAILFSDHNVCQDPPFQRIDMVCCRNLLIYFESNLQKKVLSRFHYAMNPNALMFLGTAESIAGSDEFFALDRDAMHVFRKRILRKSEGPGYNMPNVQLRQRSGVAAPAPDHAVSTDRQLLQALAQSLGENSILVTEEYFIAQVYGDVSNYVMINNASNLRMHLDLLRSPLREEARSLVTISLKNGRRRSGVRHLLAENDTDQVRLDVYPIIASEINERAALVVFTPIEPDSKLSKIDSDQEVADDTASARISVLENEVATTREALQQTIEELETSNEELQSLNEELQSTNEELQATNEELETSNEELQSTNEELITVNEELQVTATELTGRTGELASVLESSPIAILVTDTALQVTQTTAAGAALFGLVQPISAPHISQCVLPPGYPSLATLASNSLRLGEAVESEFTSQGSKVMLTCSPYFNNHGQVSGVTIVTTVFPGMAKEMEMILESSDVFVMQRDKDGVIMRISSACEKVLGPCEDGHRGHNISEFVSEESYQNIRQVDDLLLSGAETEISKTVPLTLKNSDETLWLNKHMFAYTHHSTGETTVYSVATDATKEIRQIGETEALLAQIGMLQETANIGYWSVDLVGQTVHWSKEVHRIHRTDPGKYQPTLEDGINYYHPDDADFVRDCVEKAMDKQVGFSFKKRLVVKDGEVVHIESHGLPVTDTQGKVVKIVGVFKEIAPETA